MAICIIFGPGGSGKSFYQLHVVVKELRSSRRNIVTNLAINVPELNAYLEREYPTEKIDLVDRLRILTDGEGGEAEHFWDFRGPRRWSLLVPEELGMEEDKGLNGVAYLIDEAGLNGFNAQGWAMREHGTTRGSRASWYLDQQRKLGDNVYASHNGTNPHGIAKPFRDKAHDFSQLRNGRLRKMGVFKARGVFTAWHYYVEPGPNVEYYAKEDFPLDMDLASCYRTGDGVGIVGGKADIGAKVKGIPVLMAFPLAIALGSLCWIVPWFLGHSLNRHIKGASSTVHMGVSAGIKAVGGVEGAQRAGNAGAQAPSFDAAVTVSGYAEYDDGGLGLAEAGRGLVRAAKRRLEVLMSDGQRYTSEDVEIKRLSSLFWEIDGKVYRYLKPVVVDKNGGGISVQASGVAIPANNNGYMNYVPGSSTFHR